jgi:hypothetical protein
MVDAIASARIVDLTCFLFIGFTHLFWGHSRAVSGLISSSRKIRSTSTYIPPYSRPAITDHRVMPDERARRTCRALGEARPSAARPQSDKDPRCSPAPVERRRFGAQDGKIEARRLVDRNEPIEEAVATDLRPPVVGVIDRNGHGAPRIGALWQVAAGCCEHPVAALIYASTPV